MEEKGEGKGKGEEGREENEKGREEKRKRKEGKRRDGRKQTLPAQKQNSISEKVSYSFRRPIQPIQKGTAKVNPLSSQCHNAPKLMLP